MPLTTREAVDETKGRVQRIQKALKDLSDEIEALKDDWDGKTGNLVARVTAEFPRLEKAHEAASARLAVLAKRNLELEGRMDDLGV